jgi:hypothetical protein
VRLKPAQQSYSHGQVVDIEFLYRNVLSKEISATLPPSFQFGQVRGIRLVRAGFVRPTWPNGSVSAAVGNEPFGVRGHRMQICFDEGEPIKEGVNLKAITSPGAQHYISFEIPDPTSDANDRYLKTGRGLRFGVPALTPAEILPLYTGHYYRHWGTDVPGHRQPSQSTPDPSYVDPFMLGLSLGAAEASRIPAYFAGGLEVTKVAPHSPAEKAGIEQGDIILAWAGHQIYGRDPRGKLFQSAAANRQLNDYQQRLKKSARLGGLGSGGTRFVLLDHRTGEVLDIAPWYGAAANGDLTKAQIIERLQQRAQQRGR